MKSASGSSQPRSGVSARMERLGIHDDEITETFARSSGPGGQNVNKVSTAVTLRWREFSVSVQDSRSQQMNRLLARERLCEMVESERRRARQERQAEAAKARARIGKRPAHVKRRILAGKKKRSETKARRRSSIE